MCFVVLGVDIKKECVTEKVLISAANMFGIWTPQRGTGEAGRLLQRVSSPSQKVSMSEVGSSLMGKKSTSVTYEVRQRFHRLVEAAGGTVAVGERIGCSRATVGHIIEGRRTPGLGVALAIERELGFDVHDWFKEERA